MHTDLIYGNYAGAIERNDKAPYDREIFSFGADVEVSDGGRGAEKIVDELDADADLLARTERIAAVLGTLTRSQRVLCILTLFHHKSARECQVILGITRNCLNKRLKAIERNLAG